MRWPVLIVICLLVVVGIYAAYTAYQGVQLQQSLSGVSSDSVALNAAALADGDCSQVAEMEDLIKDIKSACKNPALKYIIEKKAAEAGQENICTEIKNPENEYLVRLEEIKAGC